MHRHWCWVCEHFYDCGEDCFCICDLPMTGFDHGGCPVELRPCPEHKAEAELRMAQACTPEEEAESKRLRDEWQARPYCGCGCACIAPGKVVGWCLHCDHVYAEYSPKLQDWHFAHECPGAPEALKQAARARFAQHA